MLRPGQLCGVESPVTLFDAASPLVPGKDDADMVRARLSRDVIRGSHRGLKVNTRPRAPGDDGRDRAGLVDIPRFERGALSAAPMLGPSDRSGL